MEVECRRDDPILNCPLYKTHAQLPKDWCNQIDEWAICGVADGTVSGSGYGCKFQRGKHGYCKALNSGDQCNKFQDPCGCGTGKFCNFDDGHTGGCEDCSNHANRDSCYSDGLPSKGAEDCSTKCFGMAYKVSNRGETTWRPAVSSVRVYSDSACKREIQAIFNEHSGSNNGNDGSKAFDDDAATSWRPQCPSCGDIGCVCTSGEAWLTFSAWDKVKCVEAVGLGKGSGHGRSWNGGITVESKNPDGSWTMIMESTSGDKAFKPDA